MKELFSRTTTTSVIGVMLICGSFFLLGYLAVKYGADATTRTQIITGLLTSLAAVTGYYFGSSKQRGITQQADTITNAPSPAAPPEQANPNP